MGLSSFLFISLNKRACNRYHVVDDAIVVGENVYRRIRNGEDPRDASWRGTHEVGVVVIFGVLTTAVAFTPMLGISGVSGKIWRNIPWIVIPTLLFSLIQSKLIRNHVNRNTRGRHHPYSSSKRNRNTNSYQGSQTRPKK